MSIPQPGTTDLAVEPDKRIQPSGGGGMEPPGFGKRLMSVLRAVYHMLRRGLCRKRLMMDLHLLFGRGKLAGKALRNLVAAAHHHPHAAARQLRVTDSPFPIEPEGVVDERANSNFDAFIKKFYENLRLQAANATPDNHVGCRRG